MMKTTSAIMAAATVAAAVTVLTAPSAPVAAGPLATAAAAPMTACMERPWRYLRCVGNPLIRPIAIERLE